MELRGKTLRVLMHMAASLCFLLFGYDQGVFGGILSTRAFLNAYHVKPTDTIIGTASAIYSIGAVIGCIFSAIYGLRLGRRRTLMLGCVWVIVGAVIQAASPTIGVMIAGRIIAGVGVGMNTSTVPIWIAEISKPKERGRNVAVQLWVVNTGFMTVYWFTYGMSFVEGEVSFRLPIAGQCFFMVLALPLLFILPETPRVLFKWGRIDEATELLARLEDTSVDDERIISARAEIMEALEAETLENKAAFMMLLRDRSDIKYARRALITLGVFLLQQFGGCTFLAYYAPIIFNTSIGLSSNLSSIMSCVMATTCAIGAFVAIWVIDRFPRRQFMIWGAIATSIPFIILTALVSKASAGSRYGWPSAAMVLMFQFFFSVGWDCLPWIYGSELMPLSLRHVNGAIGAFGEFMFQFTVLEMAPPAIASSGWKIYLFFMVFNILTVPFVYFFCPETQGKTLEEIDFLFYDDNAQIAMVLEGAAEHTSGKTTKDNTKTSDKKSG